MYPMNRSLLYVLFFTLIFVLPDKAEGQGSQGNYIINRLEQSAIGEGEVSVVMDSLVEVNLKRHIMFNMRNPGIPGFRIRIFSDSGFDAKERAVESRTRFISKHENIAAYIQYDIPNYKVYAGDCRTRSEALKILEMVKKDFPNAFIVAQNINLIE